jgi:CRISPR-associated exonuclease Cas4
MSSFDDFLPLSGIQHFAFCPRQWALIHIEKQWLENLRTVQGRQLHERVDNPDFFESRGDILITRSVPLASQQLRFYGVADMVEFHAVEGYGVHLPRRKGKWIPIPVEYKRGRPKKDDVDEVQLCAQAICLEEMLAIDIPYGYMFYGVTRRRTKVLLDTTLRENVNHLAQQMHQLFEQNITPKPVASNKCRSCSMEDICLPNLEKKQAAVRSYIAKYLEEV